MSKKRFVSMLCAIMLVVGMVPAMAWAANPISTDVVIHKMQVSSGTGLIDHDGTGLTSPPGTPLEGIIFKYWTISPAATSTQMAEIQGLSTIEQIEAYASANSTLLTDETTLAATDSQGIIRVNGMAEGTYLFGEVNGAASNISEYLGVPFLLELPQMKTDGSGYFATGTNALHVYPKNVKKDVGLDIKTVNEADTQIGGADFTVQKYNAATSTYETVTAISAGGKISLPNGYITLASLPAGQYQLVNTVAPSGYVVDSRPVGFTVSAGEVIFVLPNSPMSSFTPATPTTNPIITIQFKIKSVVEKTVENGGTEQVGETVTWKVKAKVPTLIADYATFTLVDTIDTRLDCDASNVVVKIGATTLTPGTHYSAAYVDTDCKLTVDFTPSSLTAYEDETIEVTCNTKINETAFMGQEIPNNVELNFDNGHGHITAQNEITPPTIPTVWTGGAKFKKVDGANNTVVLEGAEFKIATDATGTTILKWTQDLMDANTLSLFVSPTVGADIIMKSGTDGIFEIKGLKGGTYYLVETKAPSNGGTQYNLLRDPAPFQITKTSYQDVNTASVENNTGLQIPLTGGVGTILFTVIGIVLMGAAIVLFRRKRKTDAAE